MSLFVVSDVLELVVELGSETSIGEGFLVPLRQSFLVESILKVLKLRSY